jgi:arylsulfatase A-like enzyme
MKRRLDKIFQWLKQTIWYNLLKIRFIRNFYNLYKIERWWLLNKSDLQVTKSKIDNQQKSLSQAKLKNIILIVVDCLRADHLSLLNYNRETSPFLKKLSEKSIVCRNAYTTAPWTYPSVVSILSGLYPHKHGAGIFRKERSWKEEVFIYKPYSNVVLLPEILGQYGYSKFLLSSIPWTTINISDVFDKTFYYFKTSARHLFTLAKRVIKNISTPFFIYLHLGDLHEPVYFEKYPKLDDVVLKRIRAISEWRFTQGSHLNTEEFNIYKFNRILLYDTLIRRVDEEIEKFFDFMKDENLQEDTIIIITADHGEGFWEHAEEEKKFFKKVNIFGVAHGHSLFQEYIRVPLIIWENELYKKSIEFPVSTVDILPTILDLLNMKKPDGIQGISLIRDELSSTRKIIIEEVNDGYDKKAIIKYPYKLIYSPYEDIKLLYNLEKDPFEKEPIQNSNIIESLLSLLPDFIERKTEQIDVEEGLRHHLRGLGYLS